MFFTDPQTLSDLQIFPSAKNVRSVFELFNDVESYGGKYQLEKMFRNPLSDKEEILNRIEFFKYLETNELDLTIEHEVLDFIEHYLYLVKVPSRYSFIDGLRKSLGEKFKSSNEYYIIKRAIKWLIELIGEMYRFALETPDSSCPVLATQISARIISIVDESEFKQFIGWSKRKLSSYDVEKFDYLLRYLRKPFTRELLDIIYQIDACKAVVRSKTKHGFVFPVVVEGSGVNVEGLYHPFIVNPVSNDYSLDSECNTGFITGANMAGKSTFMKSFGVAVYLAHMGFPVPAKQMEFSVFNGLFTTINVPDDLSLGYSHFYAEVKRIKFVAEQLGPSRKYVVLFDELFRGTNVKDAFEATVAVIRGFSAIRNSIFIFSSHIIEAAEELRETLGIKFQNFPTEIENDILRYPYRIRDGISDDRFGMYIIEREGIIDLLNKESADE